MILLGHYFKYERLQTFFEAVQELAPHLKYQKDREELLEQDGSVILRMEIPGGKFFFLQFYILDMYDTEDPKDWIFMIGIRCDGFNLDKLHELTQITSSPEFSSYQKLVQTIMSTYTPPRLLNENFLLEIINS